MPVAPAGESGFQRNRSPPSGLENNLDRFDLSKDAPCHHNCFNIEDKCLQNKVDLKMLDDCVIMASNHVPPSAQWNDPMIDL